MSGPVVSVVVRVKDEAPALARLLGLLDKQELPGRELEVIVVDSGSADGSDEVARERGATVIAVPAAEFSFGGALNTGCEAARGDLIASLSAHAFPRDDGWLARLADVFADPRVACACGDRYAPGGAPLEGRIAQDLELAERYPQWGYSNAAGAFRADLWRRHAFRPELPGTEDKAWAHHWLGHGLVCVVGADLAVDHDHSRDPLAEQFTRSRREWVGFAMYLDLAPYGLGELAGEWWREPEAYRSRWRARLAPQRAARLLGKYAGRRRAP